MSSRKRSYDNYRASDAQEPPASDLVERVRLSVELLGVTATELAKRLGVSQGTVWPWLMGKGSPNADALARLPKVLHVSGHWLLTGEGEIGPPEASEPLIGAFYAGLGEVIRHVREAQTELAQYLGVVEDAARTTGGMVLRKEFERGFQLGVEARHAADRTNPTPSTTEGAKLLEAPGGPQTDPEPSPLLPAATPPQSEDEDRTA